MNIKQVAEMNIAMFGDLMNLVRAVASWRVAHEMDQPWAPEYKEVFDKTESHYRRWNVDNGNGADKMKESMYVALREIMDAIAYEAAQDALGNSTRHAEAEVKRLEDAFYKRFIEWPVTYIVGLDKCTGEPVWQDPEGNSVEPPRRVGDELYLVGPDVGESDEG